MSYFGSNQRKGEGGFKRRKKHPFPSLPLNIGRVGSNKVNARGHPCDRLKTNHWLWQPKVFSFSSMVKDELPVSLGEKDGIERFV